MKTHRLLAIGLVAAFSPACDQAEPADAPAYEFRGTSKDNCHTLKASAATTLKSPGTEDPTGDGDPAPWWIERSFDTMRNTAVAALAGSVRYMDGAEAMCSDVCAKAKSEWLGTGCAVTESFSGDIVGEIETDYGLAPVFELHGEVELGCACAE